jgi:TolB-like protein/DNA-binding winged helix-turn-helix (wHTH) protein/Tfp pilus assembly protein PilF
VLVQERGHLFNKDDLMERVWPDDKFVEEGNLTRNVSTLRMILGETSGNHEYIETVPKRGYRFVASVRDIVDGGSDLIVEEHAISQVVIEEKEETSGQDKAERAFEHDANTATSGFRVLNAEAMSRAEHAASVQHGTPIPTNVGSLLRIGKNGKGVIPALATLVILVVAAIGFGLFKFIAPNQSQSKTAALASGPTFKSMAVLPFKRLEQQPSDEYLGLGMADSLITRLSNVRQIVIRPTSAVRNYASQEQDPVAAGRELKVDSVLEGSISRLGDRVRVTVQLISVEDGRPVWADKFDEKYTDIFTVEDAISKRVAEALVLRLTGEEKARLAKRYTENTEAYQLYMMGRFYWSNPTAENLEKSREYFERAIEKDQRYALAYTGLADYYGEMGVKALWPPKEAWPKSEAAAVKALEIDDTLAEAHNSLALVKLEYDWDWPASERELKRALELNPSYGITHKTYASYWRTMGRSDQAIAEARQALELDPLSVNFNYVLGRELFFSRQYDQAIEQLRKTIQMDPNFLRAHLGLGNTYLAKGAYEEAILELKKAVEISKGGPNPVAFLANAYARSGNKAGAEELLEELKDKQQRSYVSTFNIALIYTGLGEKDQAFAWLEKAYHERSIFVPAIKAAPAFDELRSDPRFIKLMLKLKLTS